MKKLLILFLLFRLFSCTEKDRNFDKVTPGFKTQTFLYDKYTQLEPENLFSSIEFIDLEVNDYSIFVDIDKFLSSQNSFFILDALGTNYIYRFNRSGRFSNRIGKIGEGPGEYFKIADFWVDDHQVYVLDRTKKKLIFYDLDGNYIKEDKLPFRADSFIPLDNGDYLFSLMKIDEEFDLAKILLTDSVYRVKNTFLKYPTASMDNKRTIGVFTESTTDITYHKPVSDSILVFNKTGELKKVLFIDFNDKSTPQAIKNDYGNIFKEEFSHQEFKHIFRAPFILGDTILLGNVTNGKKTELFYFNLKNSDLEVSDYSTNQLSHKSLNFPLSTEGDSVIISFFSYEHLLLDKDSMEIDSRIKDIVKSEKEGFVLVLHKKIKQ